MRHLIIGAWAVVAFGGMTSAAQAQTYAGTTSYVGSEWLVTWPTLDPAICNPVDLDPLVVGKPVVATIDGVDIAARVNITDMTPADTSVSFTGTPSPALLPNGTLSKLTVDGLSSITCGTYILQLPAAAPTPAAIPTMGEWAMILLSVLLAGGAALTIHRRRTA